MTRGMLVVLLVGAACGHEALKTAQPVGDSLASAIAIAVHPDRTPGSLHGVLHASFGASRPARWYSVDLPAGSLEVHLTYAGGVDSVSCELLDSRGTLVGSANPEVTNEFTNGRVRGGRDVPSHQVSGHVYVRVFATDASSAGEPYEIEIWFAPTPDHPDAAVACDPLNIDRKNPRCAGVEPCDPNRPDFKNPTCCQIHCFTDRPCSSSLASDAPGLGWIPLGARQGITVGYQGRFSAPSLDGGEVTGTFSIMKVEQDRSRIGLDASIGLDRARLDRARAKLYPPDACTIP